MKLRQATRQKAKIRLGLSGPAGSGKTYTALLIAHGMCDDWTKIAVIDTENNSADLYAHLGPYNVLPLSAPFTPERFIEAIGDCQNAAMEVIIIDSTSHEWEGKGGCLEIMDQLGGKYQDWAKVTPRHQAFIQSMLSCSAHIITTVRRKQDYEMVKDGTKMKVEKVGLKEVQREGFEYELTANIELDMRHNATASKDRTGLFMDKPSFVPSEATGRLIMEWCEMGEDVQAIVTETIERMKSECKTSQSVVEFRESLPELIKSNEEIVKLGRVMYKSFLEEETKQKQEEQA